MFIRTLDVKHHQFSLVFMFSLQLPACIFLSTILLGGCPILFIHENKNFTTYVANIFLTVCCLQTVV